MEGKKKISGVEEERLTRSALGRNAFIGELYDIRTETLKSRSLFRNSCPTNLIRERDISRTELEYKLTKNISDRFELLKVEADLQLSLLIGLIKAQGSGQFLMKENTSEETVTCSLICKFQTVIQTLLASSDEMIQHLDLKALEDSENTHVVVEIGWGANCLLTLESIEGSGVDNAEIQGFMKAELSKIKSLVELKGEGLLEKKNEKNQLNNNVNVKICADVIPSKSLPTSIESFRDLILEIPSLLKTTNNGKGKPLYYGLVSLASFRKVACIEISLELAVRSIDESFLISTIYLFEDINQIKRKLYDLNKEISNYQKYVDLALMKQVREHQMLLEKKESELKTIIAEDWASVKAGRITIRDLIKKVDKFRNRDLNLLSFEDFLDSCSIIREKLNAVKNFLSKGCIYLGKMETFDDLVAKFALFEFIVLIFSSKSRDADLELHMNTCCLFLAMVNEKRPQTQYVVVDLDLQKDGKTDFLKLDTRLTKCINWKNGVILNPDMYQQYLIEKNSNFGRLSSQKLMECTVRKPGSRVCLEMTCPGLLKGTCNPKKIQWVCFFCRHSIEYGFDGNFYCECGKAASNEFEFRCSHPNHGSVFIQPTDSFLKKELSVLRPLKEINILLLGQSGVGKSTWINSILNYMSYSTLDKAKEGGVICEIPINILVSSRKTLKNYQIQIGKKSSQEDTTPGKSATQCCHTYTLRWQGRCVRLIDTPGLGDTRGINQDKKNMENIINHLKYLKELHGICILLKANDDRINAVFSYCLKELLVNLHKSVARNIVFCFTNARTTFYGPGRTSVLLQALIENLDVKAELTLGNHNTFYLDNESFVFLCSLTNTEIEYEDYLVDSFAKSWEISLNETFRLFSTILNFEPHLLQETFSLVSARFRIIALTEPIAEVTKTIQMNISAIERKKKDIQTCNQTIDNLQKKLIVKEIHLVPVMLQFPRTVCTSSKCVEYHVFSEKDITQIEYKTVCHDECGVNDVEPKTVGNALLKNCEAMIGEKCRKCGCGWEMHMHMKVAQNREYREVVNKNVEKQMLMEQSDVDKIKAFVKNLEEKTTKYKMEQEKLIQISVKFGIFLKQNAITVFNDGVADYLQYLINEEEKKPNKTKADKELLASLIKTLAAYEAEVKILQNVIQKSKDSTPFMTVKDVLELEQELYALELTGEDIKKSVGVSKLSTAKAVEYNETPLKIQRLDKQVPKNSIFPNFSNFNLSDIKRYFFNEPSKKKLQKN